MRKTGGFPAIEEAVRASVDDWLREVAGSDVGDSPIERLLVSALRARAVFGRDEFDRIQVVDAEIEAIMLQRDPVGPMFIVRPQASILGWRSDFLIHSSGYLWRGSPIGWRRLIVECDGHDFHERTKEQAARDRARDRSAALADITLLRFTGSEIWNDPWSCAGQIMRWAQKGLG